MCTEIARGSVTDGGEEGWLPEEVITELKTKK